MTQRNPTDDAFTEYDAFDAVPRPLLVHDEGVIQYANDAFRTLSTGRAPEANDDEGDDTHTRDEHPMADPVGRSVGSVLADTDGIVVSPPTWTATDPLSAVGTVSVDAGGERRNYRLVVGPTSGPNVTGETDDGAGSTTVLFERLDTTGPDGGGALTRADAAVPDDSWSTGGESSSSRAPEPQSGDAAPAVGEGNVFERIFEYANDAIFVVDPETREITRTNRRAAELLGYDREELLDLEPADIHPHDYEEFAAFADEVYETGASWTDELSCYTCDGERIPAEISGTLVEIDGERRLVASVRDISTRIEQRTELRRLSRAVRATSDGVALFDDDGTVVYANQAYATALGYDDETDVVGESWAALYDDGDRFAVDVRPSVASDGEWSDTVTVATDDGERVHRLSVSGFEGDVLVVSRDVTAEHENRRRLRGLTEASRAFVDAETPSAVADRALDVIRETLEFDLVCLRTYDEETNSLDRVGVTDAAATLVDSEVAYDLEASRAGRAYRTGETLVDNSGEDPYAPDRAHLHVPIGDDGVVTVLREDGAFSPTDVELLELFAETVRTALARARRVRELRSQKRELERRGEELTAANEFGDLVTGVVGSVLETATRSETEQAVVDGLVGSELFDAAWLVDGAPDDPTARATAVDGASLAESDPASLVHTPFATQLLSEADRTDGLVVRRRRLGPGETDSPSDDDSGGTDGPGATTDTTTAAAIEVETTAQSFGTLVVATSGTEASRSLVRDGLELLAETLAFALVADRTRLALVANEIVEVEIELENRLARLSAAHDCRCVLRATEPAEDGGFVHRVDVSGAGVEAVRGFFDRTETDPDQSPTVVDGDENECVIDVYADHGLPALLAEVGCSVRSLVADDGVGRVTVEMPEDRDLGAVTDLLSEWYDDVHLRAKRHERRIDPSNAISTDTGLTDRQREVLCTAHDEGYYAWPRERTAEEVAATLDIAGSTLHQHLRAAERKLIEQVCGDESR